MSRRRTVRVGGRAGGGKTAALQRERMIHEMAGGITIEFLPTRAGETFRSLASWELPDEFAGLYEDDAGPCDTDPQKAAAGLNTDDPQP